MAVRTFLKNLTLHTRTTRSGNKSSHLLKLKNRNAKVYIVLYRSNDGPPPGHCGASQREECGSAGYIHERRFCLWFWFFCCHDIGKHFVSRIALVKFFVYRTATLVMAMNRSVLLGKQIKYQSPDHENGCHGQWLETIITVVVEVQSQKVLETAQIKIIF